MPREPSRGVERPPTDERAADREPGSHGTENWLLGTDQARFGRARAQAEPLAALIAVSFIAIAVGLYAGYLTQALPGQSDQALEGPVEDQIWDDLQSEGIYPNETGGPDGNRLGYPAGAVEDRSVPPGTNVYVVVTTVDDNGRDVVVGEVHLDQTGGNVSPTSGPPERARTAVRSIPVEMDPGDVRTGTLRVEVWEP